ncbi:hypothetical protein BVX98_00060 [bacterium F11]|nr:hypothetical protein BVX98_00060 [bacterium F11]
MRFPKREFPSNFHFPISLFMRSTTERLIRKSLVWFVGVGFCLMSLVGVPLVGSWIPYDLGWDRKMDSFTEQRLQELSELGLLQTAPKGSVRALLKHQKETGQSLGKILRDPVWCQKLGLQSESYKATWYMSNPYDLLPPDLQKKIRERSYPFRSRIHVWQWCRKQKISRKWRRSLYAALIETTPHNLWRASQGQRPFTKNGQFLEPIVVDHGEGYLEVRNGHIATDPGVIPTNSDVLLLVKIQGVDRILRVKAADTGGAIKGKHVDLPITVGPEAKLLPDTRLPKNYIRNRTVQIITPTT